MFEIKAVSFIGHLKELIGLLNSLNGEFVDNRSNSIEPVSSCGQIGESKTKVAKVLGGHEKLTKGVSVMLLLKMSMMMMVMIMVLLCL